MLHVSMESARLKFGINGMTMKSRTYPSTARSHVLPSVPARISAPHTVSALPAFFRRRKAAAISGTAASDTASQILDGNSPQAMPRFVASWIPSRRGTSEAAHCARGKCNRCPIRRAMPAQSCSLSATGWCS